MINKKMSIQKLFIAFALLLLTAIILNGNQYVKAEGKVNGEEQIQKELPDRFLKADGKVLRNQGGKGEVVTLRGTNIGGWQVMEAWMCPTNAPDQKTAIATLTKRFGRETAEELLQVYEKAWITEQDFEHFKDLNFNVVRLPISYYNLLDEEGSLRADTLATLDWFVGECEKRDIYVILDLHAAPGSQNGRDHSGDSSGSLLYSDEASQNLTIALWEQLAEHYKGNPTIAGYDLLNEPEGNESERYPWGKVQLPFYDRLYKAIRAIDPDHIIIFNSIWEPSNMPDPSKFGWENVMYEYHYYCWDGTDNPQVQRSFTDQKVKNNNSAGFQVPVLIGEFTLFEKLSSWKYALKIYEENGWSWTTWTYKTVGQGSWGIFNSTTSSTQKVDIYYDSEETIREKWSKVGTAESFTKNKYYYDLLKSAAGEGSGSEAKGKWFQNADMGDVLLRTGTDAEASVVSSEETHSKVEDSNVIRLTINGAEKRPTATSRNVCISPAIRTSVDATGMDYLLFDVYARKGNQALQVTLVDGNGAVWSDFTSPLAMPEAYQWERLFLDLTKASIDRSNIIEIRIGANYPGTYYFDQIYFAQSYVDPLPDETKELMQADLGEKGQIIDWVDVPKSSEEQAKGAPDANTNYKIIVIAGITVIFVLTCSLLLIIRRRKRKEKRHEINYNKL